MPDCVIDEENVRVLMLPLLSRCCREKPSCCNKRQDAAWITNRISAHALSLPFTVYSLWKKRERATKPSIFFFTAK
uniref:Uncharacterized protein n=1 Tax=Anguilla anguilla TaxID=7936 RepID=A0A0E9WJL6_ANGAN